MRVPPLLAGRPFIYLLNARRDSPRLDNGLGHLAGQTAVTFSLPKPISRPCQPFICNLLSTPYSILHTPCYILFYYIYFFIFYLPELIKSLALRKPKTRFPRQNEVTRRWWFPKTLIGSLHGGRGILCPLPSVLWQLLASIYCRSWEFRIVGPEIVIGLGLYEW